MKVLFTGGSGFIGRNVIPILREKYEVIAPTRSELNLLDTKEVEKYVIDGKFDIIISSLLSNSAPDPKTYILPKYFLTLKKFIKHFKLS